MVDFISYWYIHPSHQGSENYAGKSKLSSPQPLHPALPGESQARDLVSPVCPGSSKGSPPSGTCPDHLTREASRSHLAKSLYSNPSHLILLLSMHRMEILTQSIKVINRIGDNGQPLWSPRPTENGSDLLPEMQTKLCHWSYRDETARIRGLGTRYHRSTPSQNSLFHGKDEILSATLASENLDGPLTPASLNRPYQGR